MNLLWNSRIKKLPLIGYTYELLQTLKNPKPALSIWRDYFATRKQYKKYFKVTHGCHTNSAKILVVSMTNDVYSLKIEMMLALELVQGGSEVVVLTSSTNYWAKRYYKLIGVRSFIFIENIGLKNQDLSETNKFIEQYLQNELTVQAIKNWRYRSAKIGPQILATLSRMFFQGSVNLNQEDVKQKIRELLPIVLQTVHKAETILDKTKPTLIYLIEANYAINGVLVDKAIERDISVIQVNQPSRDDALIMKRLTKRSRGTHPNSLDAETMNIIKQQEWTNKHDEDLNAEFSHRYGGKWFLQNRNMVGSSDCSRQELIEKYNFDANKKIACIFSHVLWDANLFYGEDLFEDYGDWFIETVKLACANPAVNWLVKLHPVNVWKRQKENLSGQYAEITLIEQHIGSLPEHVKLIMPEHSIKNTSLFNILDYGLTVRGTIGIELPCFGIKTLTCGTGRYSNLGFTEDSQSKMEYCEKVLNIQNLSPMTPQQIMLAKKHAYALFFWRAWQMHSFKAEFKLSNPPHPLDHNLWLDFAVTNSNKLDLKRWSNWALNSNAIDYLESQHETNT